MPALKPTASINKKSQPQSVPSLDFTNTCVPPSTTPTTHNDSSSSPSFLHISLRRYLSCVCVCLSLAPSFSLRRPPRLFPHQPNPTSYHVHHENQARIFPFSQIHRQRLNPFNTANTSPLYFQVMCLRNAGAVIKDQPRYNSRTGLGVKLL